MNVPGAYQLIQIEEVDFDSPVSASVFNRIAAVVNQALSLLAPSAVGEIEISLLTEAQFQAQKGDGWVLVDGRNVADSLYATTFGVSTIPDFRGLFLRGKNNGAGTDPQGELATGTQITSSENRVHGHPNTLAITQFPSGLTFFAFWNTQITLGGGGATRYHGGAYATEVAPSPAFSIANFGIAEARARNITVNYFIKIN